MSLAWHALAFPAEVEAEAVATVLRTLASEPRQGPGPHRRPVVLQTELRPSGVRWRIGARPVVVKRLMTASETVLPGLTWTPIEEEPIEAAVAVELRVRSIDRLLDVDQAEGSVRRMLGVAHELRTDEVVSIVWLVGSWLARSPVPPASSKREERSVWNIHEWGHPELDTEEVAAARRKATEGPVFACVGRIAVAGATGARAHHLVAAVAGGMQQLRAPGVGISRRALPSWVVKYRLRSLWVPSINPACRLTASELAGLVGWPVGTPRLPGVRYVASKVLPLDERSLVPAERVRPTDRVLGESGYPMQAGKVVVLPPQAALRHTHLTGPTGAGKSTIAARLAIADIAAGRGVVLVDPKGGDLVRDILARLPEGSDERVVVLDPSDPAPVGFNPLRDGAVGIDGLIHVIKETWPNTIGARTTDLLLAGLNTLALSPGHSLTELPRLLQDPGYRRPLVARAVQVDPLGLGSFWPWFDSLSAPMAAQVLAPIGSRLRSVLLRPELRAVLGQAEPRFDLREVFTRRRVLLVSLPAGQITSSGARLLGATVVAAVWRLAQGRAAIPPARRHPVGLYLDELHEVMRLNVDLSDALVQARSLGLSVLGAHQHLGQLDPATRSALLANAHTRLSFRADFDDAAVLAKRSAGRLTADDLMGLPPFHAYAQVMVEDGPAPYGLLKTLPLGPPTRNVEEVLRANRERWGVPREVTEQRLRAVAGETSPPSSRPSGPGVIGGRRVPEELS